MSINLLKSKRALMGLTQKEVAIKIGISEKSFNHKEQGKIMFNTNEIVKVSNTLGLNIKDVNEIFFNNDLPNV